MINYIKVFIYRLYLYYNWHFPIQRGKTFFGRRLYKLMGNADFKIGDFRINLCILSLIDQYILRTGEYDGRIVSLIKRCLVQGGGFIDIGANFGYYSLIAAHINNVHVFSFEPSPREVRRLEYNFRLNKLSNIKMHQLALGNATASLVLNLHGLDNPGQNSLLVGNQYARTVVVKCKRMDEVLSADVLTNIRLIKIDVEGFEYAVLEGMDSIIDAFTGIFIIEMNYDMMFNGAASPDKIYNWMEKRDFFPADSTIKSGQYDEIFEKRISF